MTLKYIKSVNNVAWYESKNGKLKPYQTNKYYQKRKHQGGLINGLALTKDQIIDIFKNKVNKTQSEKQMCIDYSISRYFLKKILNYCNQNLIIPATI